MFAEVENSKELWLIKVKIEDTHKVLNDFLQLQENSREWWIFVFNIC